MVKEGFIDIGKLKPGTTILIETSINPPDFNKHTECGFAYEITVINPEFGEITLLGGNFLKQHEEVIFVGSITKAKTRKNQIHHNLCLKFTHFGRAIVTSPVRTAKVVGSGYSYELPWVNAVEEVEEESL